MYYIPDYMGKIKVSLKEIPMPYRINISTFTL